MNKTIECYVPVQGVMIHFDHLVTALCRGASSVDAEVLTEEHARLAKQTAEVIKRRMVKQGEELCPTK